MAAAGRARAGGGAGGGGAGGGGAVARPAGAGGLRAGWGGPGARSRPPRPPCAAASQGHVWGGTCAAAALRGRGRGWAGRGGADVGPARADAGGGRGGAGPRPSSAGGGGAEEEERGLAGRALGGRRPAGSGRRLGPSRPRPEATGLPARLRPRAAAGLGGVVSGSRSSSAAVGLGRCEGWLREPQRRSAEAKWRHSRDEAASVRTRVVAGLRRVRKSGAPPRLAPPSGDGRACAVRSAPGSGLSGLPPNPVGDGIFLLGWSDGLAVKSTYSSCSRGPEFGSQHSCQKTNNCQ